MSGSENIRYGTRALPSAGHLISCCMGILVLPPPRAGRGGEGAMAASAAIENVVAEFLHLEDRGVRAPGNRLCDMRVDDLADDDVVVALLDDAGHSALDRRRCRIEDRRAGRTLVNGLAGELAVFEL